MRGHAIAVGGTGARCLESLVHLCAMGLGPDELYVLFVDADKAHASISRARTLVTRYVLCRDFLRLPPSIPLFKTRILFSTDQNSGAPQLFWSPVGDEKNLEQFFGCFGLTPEQRDLCNLLYTPAELKLEWDQGFRGRASVGAPVMACAGAEMENSPWYGLAQSLSGTLGGDFAHLMVFSSVFGATGAAGFPTLAQVLRDAARRQNWSNPEKFKIGGALLLPYFGYEMPPDPERLLAVYARPQDFVVNAKAALSHYSYLWKEGSPYDAIYLAGDQTLDTEGRRFAEGGADQQNDTHYIEMVAALAALHFYNSPHAESRERLQYYAGREAANLESRTVDWEDLPFPPLKKGVPSSGVRKEKRDVRLKDEMVTFASLAAAYASFYFRLVCDDRFERRSELSPWYVDHFERGELALVKNAEEQKELLNYFAAFLDWACEFHFSTQRDLRLLNKGALSELRATLARKGFEPEELTLRDENFKTLLDPDSSRYEPLSHGYDYVFEELCRLRRSEVKQKKAGSASGKFLAMVHEAVSRFCNRNYNLRLEA